MSNKYCSIENCINKIHGLGYCGKHYQRLYAGLDVEKSTYRDKRPSFLVDGRTYLPLGVDGSQGMTLIDEDNSWLEKYSWVLGSHGYPMANVDGKLRCLHSVILSIRKPLVADHINRNKLDNRIENLRVVSRGDNSANTGVSKNNTSGYKGVVWSTKKGKWIAQTSIGGKRKHLGVFTDPRDGAIAYDKYVKSVSEYAYLNFPTLL